MQIELRNNRDFWAGIMLIATGAGAVIIARNYAFGTTLRMGPGYFPSMLGGLLCLFGLYLVATGLRHKEPMEGTNWSLRALIVLPLALVLFGLLMEHAGFIPALLVLIVGSALAGKEFRLIEVLLLAIGLTAFSVVLFIWGLGLPYPLLVGW
jgi:putative tricarboxylic transport membrane protein